MGGGFSKSLERSIMHRVAKETRWVWIATAIAIAVAVDVSNCDAGLIAKHASASAWANFSGEWGNRDSTEGSLGARAETSYTLGPYGTDVNPYAESWAWGGAHGGFQSMLHCYGATWNDVSWGSPWAHAGVMWRDVAFTTGPSPESLRLHFRVDGIMNWGDFVYNWMGVKAAPMTDLNSWVGADSSNSIYTLGRSLVWNGLNLTAVSAGEDYVSFTGTFHVDIPFDPALQGYAWGVGLSIESSGMRGGHTVSEIDVGHSLGLIGVTDLDDHPLSVTFDSGWTLGTVPEPSTDILATCGSLLCAAFIAFKRCRSAIG
jgi:hypothetical protein